MCSSILQYLDIFVIMEYLKIIYKELVTFDLEDMVKNVTKVVILDILSWAFAI